MSVTTMDWVIVPAFCSSRFPATARVPISPVQVSSELPLKGDWSATEKVSVKVTTAWNWRCLRPE